MKYLITLFLLNLFIDCQNNSKNEKSDLLVLLEKSTQFNRALQKSRFLSIYKLFNSVFQKEISYDSFDKALKDWLRERKIKAVKTKYISLTKYSAMVSTHIYFEKSKDYYYIATNWLNLNDTWYLVWISKVLDHKKFNYGDKNKEELKKILRKIIEVAFYQNKITEIIPYFEKPNYLVILKKGREIEHDFSFSDLKVEWLTLEEIKNYASRLRLKYYIDFGTIRIFGNFAKGYVDIIPIITFDSSRHFLGRLRGAEMFFKKRDKEWYFIGFGNRF